MVISIIAFLLALAMGVYSQLYLLQIDLLPLAAIMVLVGTAFCILQPILQLLILTPLQKNEQNLVPYTIESYRRDSGIKLSSILIYLFTFFSYALAIALLVINLAHPIWLFAAWIFALGITLDLLRDEISRMMTLLNPFKGVEKLQEKARFSVKENNQEELLSSIDALSEVSSNAIQRGKLSLCNEALDSFPVIITAFLSSAKGIGHGLANDGKDKIGYTLFFLFQRLSLIFDIALRHGLEIICQHIVTVIGKIINAAAECDLSLVTYPVQVLGSLVQKAHHANMNGVIVIANSTLLEVSKSIVNNVDLTYSELVEPFQSIILILDNVAKQKFKKDKTTNLRLLQQPFIQMKEIFRNPRVANHRDTPVIIRDIDGLLGEYAALEQVMLTAPPK